MYSGVYNSRFWDYSDIKQTFIYYHTIPKFIGDKMSEILKWKCPICGKEIVSLYPNQFQQNKVQHELTCFEEKKGEGGKDG